MASISVLYPVSAAGTAEIQSAFSIEVELSQTLVAAVCALLSRASGSTSSARSTSSHIRPQLSTGLFVLLHGLSQAAEGVAARTLKVGNASTAAAAEEKVGRGGSRLSDAAAAEQMRGRGDKRAPDAAAAAAARASDVLAAPKWQPSSSHDAILLLLHHILDFAANYGREAVQRWEAFSLVGHVLKAALGLAISTAQNGAAKERASHSVTVAASSTSTSSCTSSRNSKPEDNPSPLLQSSSSSSATSSSSSYEDYWATVPELPAAVAAAPWARLLGACFQATGQLLLHTFHESWPSPGSAEAAAPGVIRDHLLLCVAAAEWFSWLLQLLPSLPRDLLSVPSSNSSSRGSTIQEKEAGSCSCSCSCLSGKATRGVAGDDCKNYGGDWQGAIGAYVHPLQIQRVVVVLMRYARRLCCGGRLSSTPAVVVVTDEWQQRVGCDLARQFRGIGATVASL